MLHWVNFVIVASCIQLTVHNIKQRYVFLMLAISCFFPPSEEEQQTIHGFESDIYELCCFTCNKANLTCWFLISTSHHSSHSVINHCYNIQVKFLQICKYIYTTIQYAYNVLSVHTLTYKLHEYSDRGNNLTEICLILQYSKK